MDMNFIKMDLIYFFKVQGSCNHPCQDIEVQIHIDSPTHYIHGDHVCHNCNEASTLLHDELCVRRNCTQGGSDKWIDNLKQLGCGLHGEFHSRVCHRGFLQ